MSEKVNKNHKAIGFIRVSSTRQLQEGDSWEQQHDKITLFAKQKFGLSENEIYFLRLAESSTNKSYNDQPIQKAIKICRQHKGQFKYVIFRAVDRFTRGGADFYVDFKREFGQLGVSVYDTEGIITNKKINEFEQYGVTFQFSVREESEQAELEKARDAQKISRQLVKNMFEHNISYVLRGYAGRQASYGLESIHDFTNGYSGRCIYVPHPTEGYFVEQMYILRAEGVLSDQEIVDSLNSQGFKTRYQNIHDPDDKSKIIGRRGGLPLTVKLLQKIIQNPVYAGVNNDKWLRENAIKFIGPAKYAFPGLVSIELFNKANRGKITIIERSEWDNDLQKNRVEIIYGDIPEHLKHKNLDNPEFPYKKYILCPICGEHPRGSFSTSKSGKRHPYYHCHKGEAHKEQPTKEWRIKRDLLHKKIKNFCDTIQFSDDYKQVFIDKVLSQVVLGREKKGNYIDRINAVIKAKEDEYNGMIKRIKSYSNENLIKSAEADLAELERQIDKAKLDRSKLEERQDDAKMVVKATLYLVEHFNEMLFTRGGDIVDPFYFSLIFDEPPTVQELIDGTPKINPLFKINRELNKLPVSLVPQAIQKWNTNDTAKDASNFPRLYPALERLSSRLWRILLRNATPGEVFKRIPGWLSSPVVVF